VDALLDRHGDVAALRIVAAVLRRAGSRFAAGQVRRAVARGIERGGSHLMAFAAPARWLLVTLDQKRLLAPLWCLFLDGQALPLGRYARLDEVLAAAVSHMGMGSLEHVAMSEEAKLHGHWAPIGTRAPCCCDENQSVRERLLDID
jgi:hypothetical protein